MIDTTAIPVDMIGRYLGFGWTLGFVQAEAAKV
jgi:hypothetical protein